MANATLDAQIEATNARKTAADDANYTYADSQHNTDLPGDCYAITTVRRWRKFKYSWRRLFKQRKFYAVSAVKNASVYCNFLGPSGVTLSAATETTKPVKTWLRYPVSYRRRARYLDTFADYVGEPAYDETGSEYSSGVNMKVYCADEPSVQQYITYLNDQDSCVAAAKLTDKIAIACCNANGWKYTD